MRRSSVSCRLYGPYCVWESHALCPAFPDYVVDHLFNTVAGAVDPTCRLTSKPSLRMWAESVICKTRCRTTTALVALSYLDRARPSMRIQMGSWAVEWAFVGALILANKVSISKPI